MTVESLNSLAKAIDKLTDAVTALHQQNRQQSGELAQTSDALARIAEATAKITENVGKMKDVSLVDSPMPAPPQGNVKVDGVWRCGAYATSDICISALIEALQMAQRCLTHPSGDSVRHRAWKEIENVLNGWRYERVKG